MKRKKGRVRLEGARKRTASSRAWLERQLNDPFVRKAKAKGYRSRAAFKLIEIDDRFRFLRGGASVLDLGAAPGGWSQVAAERAGKRGRVVAADIDDMEPLAGVDIMKADLRDAATAEHLKVMLGDGADVVLSDMAAPATGHRGTDHLRTLALFESALDVAESVLKPGGVFVGKLFQGGATGETTARLKSGFELVRYAKPEASRAQSVEVYLVATGFRKGAATQKAK
jgi:23S rRNA (uridine2552-2'-O)-methyltransferase